MNDLQKLASFIKNMKFTMMSTVGKDGSIFSRPMATLDLDENNFDGKLWFFTKLHSPKVVEIEDDQHVNLAYANPEKQQYVSVSGKASVTQDREMMKKLRKPIFSAWFPEGLEDPEIALISVDINSAELWDSPPSKVVQMAGFIKAKVTGEAYNDKAHTQYIDLNRTQH